MSDRHYWACSACDSGGHPLSLRQATNDAWRHIEETGHVAVHGAMNEGIQ